MCGGIFEGPWDRDPGDFASSLLLFGTGNISLEGVGEGFWSQGTRLPPSVVL